VDAVAERVAVTMLVIGPSTACAITPALASPVASNKQRRASISVPTPIVIARLGTLSSPPKNSAFCLIVVGRQRLDARSRSQRRERFVEADVPRFADAEQLEVNPAKPLDQGFVASALFIEVLCESIGQVSIAWFDIHMLKEMVIHVMPIGIRVQGH